MKNVSAPTHRAELPPVPLPAAARHALAGLAASVLLASLGTSIANVALPDLARAFGAPLQRVQWVVLAYLLAVTTLVVSAGRLGDLLGRRRLMLAGIGLFTVASWLCALAPTLGWLIAARALQGAGAALMMALGMAMVGAVVPKARSGSAMGWLGTMSAVGTALGPVLGGLLLAGCGWTGLFVVLVPLGALALWLAWRYLPPDTPAHQAQAATFDLPGTLVLVLTLVAYALAMTLGQRDPGWPHLALLLAAATGAGLLALVESRAVSPLIRPALLRNPILRTGFASSGLVTTVVMATLVIGPFYLGGALHLDPAMTGLVMAFGPIVAALTGAPAGRLVDRFGGERIAIAGLAGMLAGAGSLASFGAGAGLPGYVLPLALITAGYAVFQVANNTAVMRDVAADQRGVVSGLLNLSRNLGLITGASLMGAVFRFGTAADDILGATPLQLARGLQYTLGVAAVLIAVALLLAWSGRSAAPARPLPLAPDR